MTTQEQNPVDLRLKHLLATAYPVIEPSDDLLRRIAAQIERQSEIVERRSRLWQRTRLGLAFAGSAAFALVVVALIPRIAGAVALYHIQQAIGDARSMHSISWRVLPDGRRVKSEETWYQDGDWRMVDGNARYITVCNRGNRWIYQADDNTVTLDRATAPLGMEGITGFSIGAAEREDALHGVLDDVRETGSTVVNGHAARQLTIRTSVYPTIRTLLTVDARTDLPIGRVNQREIGGRWVTEDIFQDDYNVILPAALFKPDFPKTARLINRITGRAYWQRRLSKGIASESVGEWTHTWRFDMENGKPVFKDTGNVHEPRTIVLHDFQANSRGDVFAMVTADFPVNRDWIPPSNAELTDNRGTRYICTESNFANFQEQDGSFSGIATKNGECMVGIWLVPIEPIESWTPRSYTLRDRQEISIAISSKPML